ncbi:hypothetical protein FACS1894202_10350 [Clostridia bacterium]|nr:hypothetical protein FACS1894202_10350 [Clostridia bacterium]
MTEPFDTTGELVASLGELMLDPLALISMVLNKFEHYETLTRDEAERSSAYIRKAYSLLCMTARTQTSLADADVALLEAERYDAVSYLRAVTAQVNALLQTNRFKLKCGHVLLPCALPPSYLRRAALTLFAMGKQSDSVELNLSTDKTRLHMNVKIPVSPHKGTKRGPGSTARTKEWLRQEMLVNTLKPYGGFADVSDDAATVSFPRGGDSDSLVLRSPEPPMDSDDRVWLSELLSVDDFMNV